MARRVLVLIGGSDKQNRGHSRIRRLAKSGGTYRWSCPKDARPGDIALLYVRGPVSAIVAQAVVVSHAVKGEPGDWSYTAQISEVSILPREVGIRELKAKFPGWKWLRLPRRMAVVPEEFDWPVPIESDGATCVTSRRSCTPVFCRVSAPMAVTASGTS